MDHSGPAWTGGEELPKEYGSRWIFESRLTCSNALRRVQNPGFSLVEVRRHSPPDPAAVGATRLRSVGLPPLPQMAMAVACVPLGLGEWPVRSDLGAPSPTQSRGTNGEAGPAASTATRTEASATSTLRLLLRIGPPAGRMLPMPERTARQGRPEKDRPCRRGIGGFRISSWMGQGSVVVTSRGENATRAIRVTCRAGPTAALRLGQRAGDDGPGDDTVRSVPPPVLDGGPPCPCPCSCP